MVNEYGTIVTVRPFPGRDRLKDRLMRYCTRELAIWQAVNPHQAVPQLWQWAATGARPVGRRPPPAGAAATGSRVWLGG